MRACRVTSCGRTCRPTPPTPRRPTTTRRSRPTPPRRRRGTPAGHQRRPRADLPRDRRHPRAQGRDPVQDRRLSPRRRRDRPGPVRRRGRLRRRRPATDPGRRPGDRRQDRRARDHRPHGGTTTACGRRSRPASSACCGSPASGPRPCASSTRGWGSRRSRTCGRRREAGHAARPQGHLGHAPSSGSSRASSSSSRARSGCSSTAPRPSPTAWWRCWRPRPACGRIVQAGSLRRRRESIGDLDLLVETDDPDGVVAAVHRPRPGRQGHRARDRRRAASSCCAARTST